MPCACTHTLKCTDCRHPNPRGQCCLGPSCGCNRVFGLRRQCHECAGSWLRGEVAVFELCCDLAALHFAIFCGGLGVGALVDTRTCTCAQRHALISHDFAFIVCSVCGALKVGVGVDVGMHRFVHTISCVQWTGLRGEVIV